MQIENSAINFLQEMGKFNFVDKYAFDKEDGSKESWEESVSRIYDMHRLKIKNDDRVSNKIGVEALLSRAEKAEANKMFLSSQRARQWADLSDKGILGHHEKIYNCTASYCDRPDFFGESIYLLLCGCGVGFSICKRHVDKLPSVKYRHNSKTFLIPDTIEGWADAVKELVNGALLTGTRVDFDYSAIREKGSLIAGRFIHSGFQPLKERLDKANEIIAKAEGRKLKPIECYDIVCHLAEAVLSGGVRRSATICLFSWDDEEMMNAKTGAWWNENPQRAMSNISPLMVRKKVKKADVERIVKSVKEFGEPGVIFAENEDVVLNPCAEIGMIPKTADGKSGWQFCNLVEVNCNATKTEDEFKEACAMASLMATIQASYDKFPYLGKTTEQIVKGSALIGVSLTGIMDSSVELTAQLLKDSANLVKEVNSAVAYQIGIMPARRCTTVKPSGNASILLGTTSGIHPSHSKKYLRHIRLNKNGDMYRFIKENAQALIVNDDKPYDAIIAFPIENDKSKTKADFSFKEFISYVGFIFDNWVLAGDREFENVTHNVSNTVVVREDEWKDVAETLFLMKDKIGGISLLPEVGDKVYEFAPYCSVDDDITDIAPEIVGRSMNFILENKGINFYSFADMFGDDAHDMKRVYASFTYGRISKEYKPIDWRNFKKTTKTNVGEMVAVACFSGACEI